MFGKEVLLALSLFTVQAYITGDTYCDKDITVHASKVPSAFDTNQRGLSPALNYFEEQHCTAEKGSCGYSVATFGEQCKLRCVNKSTCTGPSDYEPRGQGCKMAGCRDCFCDSNTTDLCDSNAENNGCFPTWKWNEKERKCVIYGYDVVMNTANVIIGSGLGVFGLMVLLMLVNFIHFVIDKITVCFCGRKSHKTWACKGCSGRNKKDPNGGKDQELSLLPDREWDDAVLTHGWYWAKKTTIMAMDRRTRGGYGCDKNFAELLGVGLILFFATQKFLIWISLATLGVNYVAMKHSRLDEYLEFIMDDKNEGFAKCTEQNLGNFSDPGVILEEHSYVMIFACLTLWLVLLVSTWAFAKYGLQKADEFDRKTRFSEDYTIVLKNVPRHFTSEEYLKRFLEKRWHTKIYGVCIAYDMNELSKNDKLKESEDGEGKEVEGPELIEMMKENLIEHDDLHNNWFPANLGPGRKLLKDRIDLDIENFKNMLIDPQELSDQKFSHVGEVDDNPRHLQNVGDMNPFRGATKDKKKELMEGKLRGSGTVYVIFEDQNDRYRVIAQWKGILVDELERGLEENSVKEIEKRRLSGVVSAEESTLVTMTCCQEEPAGIVWKCLREGVRNGKAYDWEGHNSYRNAFILIIMLAIAVALSQIFFTYLIQPYNNANAHVSESDRVLKMASYGLLGVNVVIQCVVLLMGYEMGWTTMTKVDNFIYIWNTVLITLQTGYYVFFFSAKGTFTYLVNDATPRDVKIESLMGDSINELTSFNLYFYQYILNEICLGVMMVMLNQALLLFFFSLGWGNCRIGRFITENILIRWKIYYPKAHMTARESELNLRFPEFLPSLEYTWVIAYPAIAFAPMFMLTNKAFEVSKWLTIFAVFFFFYQRFINLWTMKATAYNSMDLFKTVVYSIGFLISLLPAGALWWCLRLGLMRQMAGTIIIVVGYLNALVIYREGLKCIGFLKAEQDAGVDDVTSEDIGYKGVVEDKRYSWWSMNPVYVLKKRYLTFLFKTKQISREMYEQYRCHDDHDVLIHDDSTPKWPTEFRMEGFVEIGMSRFRHHANRLLVTIYVEDWATKSDDFQKEVRNLVHTWMTGKPDPWATNSDEFQKEDKNEDPKEPAEDSIFITFVDHGVKEGWTKMRIYYTPAPPPLLLPAMDTLKLRLASGDASKFKVDVEEAAGGKKVEFPVKTSYHDCECDDPDLRAELEFNPHLIREDLLFRTNVYLPKEHPSASEYTVDKDLENIWDDCKDRLSP